MHGWETRMLLRHYLEPGVSKTELSRRFGVRRRSIHRWVETGQLDRDLEGGGAQYGPRALVGHQLGVCPSFCVRGAVGIVFPGSAS